MKTRKGLKVFQSRTEKIMDLTGNNLDGEPVEEAIGVLQGEDEVFSISTIEAETKSGEEAHDVNVPGTSSNQLVVIPFDMNSEVIWENVTESEIIIDQDITLTELVPSVTVSNAKTVKDNQFYDYQYAPNIDGIIYNSNSNIINDPLSIDNQNKIPNKVSEFQELGTSSSTNNQDVIFEEPSTIQGDDNENQWDPSYVFNKDDICSSDSEIIDDPSTTCNQDLTLNKTSTFQDEHSLSTNNEDIIFEELSTIQGDDYNNNSIPERPSMTKRNHEHSLSTNNEDIVIEELSTIQGDDYNENSIPERPSMTKRKKKEEWIRNKVKRLRSQGKNYTSLERKTEGCKVVKVGKKERPERKIRPICNSVFCEKSSKRHCKNISESARLVIFEKFWKMNWDERKTYVASLVTFQDKKQIRRKDSGDRRALTLHYHLNIKGERKEVCKKTFLHTFDIGEWSVRNWVTHSEHGVRSMKTVEAMETRHPKRKNRNGIAGVLKDSTAASNSNQENTRGEGKSFAIDFLNNLPKMESHYCRKTTSKLYLEPIIHSNQELYNLYSEHCKTSNRISICRFTFRELVQSMNIALFKRKKDQCDVCCQYETANITEEIYKKHLDDKIKAREEKEKDKQKALENECSTYTVDLQQVQLSPVLTASALYYKSKLCCHNHTYFNLASREVVCYWWHEVEGEIKASNFTSCFIDFLEKEITNWPETKPKHIIIWTDGCVYQNKNKTLANALFRFASRNNFLIEQKYFQKGHSQMEADSVHACIERRLKNREIHLPSDYIAVTREARQKPFPYKVNSLSHKFFKNFDINDGEIYPSIRPGSSKDDPTVNALVQLTYKSEGIFYKVDFKSDLQMLPQRKRMMKKDIVYPPMYNNRLKLSFKKWKDLQELKAVLPQETHNFYDNLPHHDKLANKVNK